MYLSAALAAASLIGAAVIGLSYAVMLVIFGSVTWLHY